MTPEMWDLCCPRCSNRITRDQEYYGPCPQCLEKLRAIYYTEDK